MMDMAHISGLVAAQEAAQVRFSYGCCMGQGVPVLQANRRHISGLVAVQAAAQVRLGSCGQEG